MRADIDIERDVKAELKWSPEVNETDIAVNLTNGVVALIGYVGTNVEKYRAEAAVKRVSGVRGVANDLSVRPPIGGPPPDPQIAREAVASLRADLPLVWQNIKVLVKQGHVGLEGTVEWHYERGRAETAVHRVRVMARSLCEERCAPGRSTIRPSRPRGRHRGCSASRTS